MRSRPFVAVLAAALVLSGAQVGAQDRATRDDRLADGLTAGDYLRVSGGIMSPINPQGSLRDWTRGNVLGVVWENWMSGEGGIGRIGFGIGVNYGMLPLDDAHFLSDFRDPLTQTRATSVNASKASVLEIETSVRFRIPAPFIMPHLSVAFGYINFRPGTIEYTTATGSASTAQQRRYGGEFTFGAGLDKHIFDRWAVFGEALYTYGFTSLGQGLATPRGTCTTSGCDPLKNTTLTVLHGGLRVRVGR